VTVLLASDTAALATWLREHGFQGRPELQAWLAPYVARSFYVTAFRFVPGSDRRALGAPVRLSFTTATPFYPYAEPAGSPPPGRLPRSTTATAGRGLPEPSRSTEARTTVSSRGVQ